MDRDTIAKSRFMSLVLRHKPEEIGLTLDAQGWAHVTELVEKAGRHGVALTPALVTRIVAESDKKRFALSADGLRIRANQGHSVAIDLGLTPQSPPGCLYHGTAEHNLASIRASGLNAASRQHVHLSPDPQTAVKVGSRHGRPVVLVVDAGAMHAEGHVFYRSDNGVWLADAVPPRFIAFPDPG